MDSYEQRRNPAICSVGIELAPNSHFIGISFKSNPFSIAAIMKSMFVEQSTSLLITANGKAVFGRDADDIYDSMSGEQQRSLVYFKNVLAAIFKHAAITDNTILTKKHGRQFKGLEVIALVMEGIISSVRSCFHDRVHIVVPDELVWTVTLPSPWNESAATLIRKGANKVGIPNSSLIVLHEAEAAAVYIQHHPDAGFTNRLKSGTSNMVLHLEETVSVCFQEVNVNQEVATKELETPYGDMTLGRHVYDIFDKLMSETFGEQTLKDFKNDNASAYDEMLNSLNKKLQRCTETGKISLRSFEFIRGLSDKHKMIAKSRYAKNITIMGDKLRFDEEITSALFYGRLIEAISKIIGKLKETKVLSDMKYVILTGRWAKSILIRETVVKELDGKEVLAPPDPSICTVQGAVMRGYYSTTTGRITQAIFAVPLVVAAIDFGTAFSGWAFSFRHEYKKDPADVYAKNWNNGDNISEKSPTTILIKPDGKTFEAFGYQAEDRYAELLAEEKHHGYYFFQRFKMLLYENKTLTRDTKLRAVNGKSLPAIFVFQLAIGYLKDNLISEAQSRVTGGVKAAEIHWTLTVPAIWDEKAKKFMKEAATKAGIDSRFLTITLEPEAASIYCQHLQVGRLEDGQIGKLGPGSQYIVVDCGGGTVDICCHEVKEGGGLAEIDRVRGNGLGGIQVDKAFEGMLSDIFGKKAWEHFKNNELEDYLELQRIFESKKRSIDPETDSLISVKIPQSLVTSSGGKTPISLYDNCVRFQSDKMRIQGSFAKNKFFTKAIEGINEMLKQTTKSSKLRNAKTILLVGGFSDSKLVQKSIRDNFPEYTLIVPKEASLAIMKGAVVFGHDTSVMTERVARYTYGKGVYVPYRASVHHRNKIHLIEGSEFVFEFRTLVKVNARLTSTFEIDDGIVGPRNNAQTEMRFPMFAVDEDTPLPQYADDRVCIKLGELVVPITDRSGQARVNEFNIRYAFGGTEIGATVIEVRTGKQTTGSFNFLG